MNGSIFGELKMILIEEFYNSFINILKITQNEFIYQYIHRINCIIRNYHNNILNDLKSNKELFNLLFNKIIKEYYIPIKEECENLLNSKNEIEYLYSFQKHCKKNQYPMHKCG